MSSHNNALSIAYSVARKNRKKMGAYCAPGEDDEEDLPEAKMSGGGMALHPKHIVHAIMIKKMADGGEVQGDDDLEGADEEMDEDSELASLPEDDPDDVSIPDLGYHSAREDIEGMKKTRKGLLTSIMRNLHAKNYGK